MDEKERVGERNGLVFLSESDISLKFTRSKYRMEYLNLFSLIAISWQNHYICKHYTT